MSRPRPANVHTSPRPMPNQAAFQNSEYKAKGHHIKTPSCPSPPAKSPPVSRLFGSRNELYTPGPHVIATPLRRSSVSLPSTPERYGGDTTFFEGEFDSMGLLGSGSFGDVFKVRHKRDGRTYAIKKARHPFRGVKDRERAIQEVNAVAKLGHHEHCVHYYNAWEELGYLFIQEELCELGSLRDYIDSHDVIPEEQIWQFLIDIALGLAHIHKNDMVHLDIKPANLFLAATGSLKIGDFGIAVTRAGAADPEFTLDLEGDPVYLPAELLSNNAVVDFSADMFSLGATLFEMAANVEMPTGGPLWHELRSGNVSFPPQLGRSADLRSLIVALMSPTPAARPSASDVLAAPGVATRLAKRRTTTLSTTSTAHGLAPIMEVQGGQHNLASSFGVGAPGGGGFQQNMSTNSLLAGAAHSLAAAAASANGTGAAGVYYGGSNGAPPPSPAKGGTKPPPGLSAVPISWHETDTDMGCDSDDDCEGGSLITPMGAFSPTLAKISHTFPSFTLSAPSPDVDTPMSDRRAQPSVSAPPTTPYTHRSPRPSSATTTTTTTTTGATAGFGGSDDVGVGNIQQRLSFGGLPSQSTLSAQQGGFGGSAGNNSTANYGNSGNSGNAGSKCDFGSSSNADYGGGYGGSAGPQGLVTPARPTGGRSLAFGAASTTKRHAGPNTDQRAAFLPTPTPPPMSYVTPARHSFEDYKAALEQQMLDWESGDEYDYEAKPTFGSLAPKPVPANDPIDSPVMPRNLMSMFHD